MSQKRYLKQGRINQLPELSEMDRINEEYEYLKKLCSDIRKLEQKKQSAQGLKNYIHIRLASIVEYQLKAVSVDIIDRFKIRPRDLLDNDEVTIHLDYLDNLTEGQITKGKVVATEYSFTNVYQIGLFFSYVNGVNKPSRKKKSFTRKSSAFDARPFFDWIQDLRHIPKEKDMFDYLDKILKKRIEIVHFLDDLDESADSIQKKVTRVRSFINLFYFATWINLSRNKKEMRKSLEHWIELKFRMSFEEFFKITDKHKVS